MDIIMKSIKPITAVLSILLLCGCASQMTTETLKPTDDTRRSNVVEKSVTTRFQRRQSPTATNPYLEIVVTQQITAEETFQRRYIKKSSPSPGDKAGLWITGIAAAGAGYYFYQQGRVVLGRDLMGLGVLIPLGGEVIMSDRTIGEQWKSETRALPPRTVPAQNTPLTVSVGSLSWTVRTNAQGKLRLDISRFKDMAEPGQPLTIDLALRQDPTQKASFTVPASVVAFYRPPPPAPAPEVEVVEIEPAASPVIDEKDRPTLAILDFEGLGISEQEAQVLTNRLGTHMVQLGRYQVIERGQMQQILREQDFQMTGCTSDECAVEIGQLLGVQQMLAGSFGKFGSIYTIDMRIIDVATGGILRTTSYDVQGEAELLLTVGLAEAARRIAGVD